MHEARSSKCRHQLLENLNGYMAVSPGLFVHTARAILAFSVAVGGNFNLDPVQERQEEVWKESHFGQSQSNLRKVQTKSLARRVEGLRSMRFVQRSIYKTSRSVSLALFRIRRLKRTPRIIHVEIEMIELPGQPHQVKYHYPYRESIKPG